MSETIMTSEQIELARRAMALPGWEWREGMLVHDAEMPSRPARVGAELDVRDDGALGIHGADCPDQPRFVIHLTDPTGATDGVLLKLLGPKVAVYYSYTNLEWVVAIPFSGVIARAPYLAEACCRAAVALGRWPGGTVKHEAKAEV